MNLETKIESNVKQAVPFFAVSNIEESLRFYVDGLGFEDDLSHMQRRAGDVSRVHCTLHPGLATLRREWDVGHIAIGPGRLPARF
jgi:hypothetical protein